MVVESLRFVEPGDSDVLGNVPWSFETTREEERERKDDKSVGVGWREL